MITAEGLIQLGYEPEVDFILQNDGGDTFIKSWLSGDAQPTQSAIEAAAVTWQTNYDAKEYARKRAAEYPSIADQLDDIYHNGVDGWKATIKVTKDKYPKG